MLGHGAGPFRAALLDEQDPDALQKFNGRIHSLGQEEVRAKVLVIHLDLAGKENCRCLRGTVFYLADEIRAIESRHEEITQDKINSALVKKFERRMTAGTGKYAIAARFKHYFTNGERLFIIINAEYGLLGSHLSPIFIFPAAGQSKAADGEDFIFGWR
jgi:hypothetical protein